jgi:ferrous iron transport protein A
MDGKTTLNHIPIGQCGTVVSLESCGKERRRMLDLGLVEGTVVQALQKSPSGDPVAYSIRGAVIALREEDARLISVLQ